MKIILILVGILLLFLLWCTIENHMFRTVSYKIRHKQIPRSFDGTRILYIADLHNTSYGKYNTRLKKAILKQQPDVVIIGGDLLSRTDFTFDKGIDLLTFLAQHYPVFFANGNHETRMKNHAHMYHETYQDFMKIASGLQVTFLNNRRFEWKRNGEKIILYGLELPEEYFKKFTRKEPQLVDISDLVGTCDPSTYSILLAHSPNYYKTYDAWGANLVLSGHNHGGMVRIPFVGGVLSTQAKLFPEYTRGEYFGKSGEMVVSAGMGSHTIKIRFLNLPELVMLTLESGEKNGTEF